MISQIKREGCVMSVNEKDTFVFLVEVAKKGSNTSKEQKDFYFKQGREQLHEKGIIVTYDDVLNHLNLNNKNRPELFRVLDNINKEANSLNFSSLVVNKKELLPGNGYFKKWLNEVDISDTSSKIKAWKKELDYIWNFYTNK